MKNKSVALMLIAVMALSGCAITHDYKAVPNIKNAGTIKIIDNLATRKGFVTAMTSWLTANGYKYVILPQTNDMNQQGWVLSYEGKWSWNVAAYLSKAGIKAYKDGEELGSAEYDIQGGFGYINPTKFRCAKKIINKMMENLFDRKE